MLRATARHTDFLSCYKQIWPYRRLAYVMCQFCLAAHMLQKVKEVGGTYLCGVNYCAMDKYPGPATAKGLKNCTDSLKVQTSSQIM